MSLKLAGITQPVELTSPLYLGSNFTWAEATRNGTRIPIDTSIGGIIIPAAQITANMVKLARELDKLRVQFGNKPIHINSWYRPEVVNKAAGGASNSQHLYGWAADVVIEGYKPHQVAAILSKTWAGGLGDSSIYTHLDLRHLMGHASARWNYGFA
jgi:zinc D-Ala-D-Ala carboxypeptidase